MWKKLSEKKKLVVAAVVACLGIFALCWFWKNRET
jgi:hypothetical protein